MNMGWHNLTFPPGRLEAILEIQYMRITILLFIISINLRYVVRDLRIAIISVAFLPI